MALFARRPLAAACGALIFAVIFSELLSFTAIQVLLSIGALLFATAIICCFIAPEKPFVIFLLLISLGLLVGSLRVLPLHLRERSLHEAEGRKATVTLMIQDTLTASAYSSELLVTITQLDGEITSGKAILKLDQSAPFLAGDAVSCVCTVMPLDADNYIENRHLQYRGEGAAVLLALTDKDTVTVQTGEQGILAHTVNNLRIRALGRIREYMKGEAGALAAAMLLGEREVLSSDALQDFRYAGVSHLLALSGLHLGILVLLAEKLLLGAGLSRKWRIFALLFLVLGYLLFTGFPISLLRAALMLLLVQLAFLFRTRADAMTSLFTAGAVMLLIAPLSFLSVSLQLTLLATFGILTVGSLSRILFRKLRRKRGIAVKLLLWPLSSLLLTFAASLFTYPIQWFTFGEVSLITPLSNLLLIFPTTLFLYLATMTLCLFPASLFGKLATAIGNLILTLANALGHPDVMLSLRGEFVPYLVFASLIPTLLLLLFRIRRKLLMLLPYAVATLLFFAIFITRAAVLEGKTAVLYGREESATCILVQDGSQTILMDFGRAKSDALALGGKLLRELDSTRLDYYAVPDAKALNENRLAAISRHLSPRNLLIPLPEDDAELALLAEIAAQYGMTLVTYEYGQPFSFHKHTALTVCAENGAITLLVEGQNESLLYQSGMPTVNSAVRYHIVSAGSTSVTETFAVGGIGQTVVVADEEILPMLLFHKDGEYLLFPEVQGFLLQ